MPWIPCQIWSVSSHSIPSKTFSLMLTSSSSLCQVFRALACQYIRVLCNQEPKPSLEKKKKMYLTFTLTLFSFAPVSSDMHIFILELVVRNSLQLNHTIDTPTHILYISVHLILDFTKPQNFLNCSFMSTSHSNLIEWKEGKIQPGSHITILHLVHRF